MPPEHHLGVIDATLVRALPIVGPVGNELFLGVPLGHRPLGSHTCQSPTPEAKRTDGTDRKGDGTRKQTRMWKNPETCVPSQVTNPSCRQPYLLDLSNGGRLPHHASCNRPRHHETNQAERREEIGHRRLCCSEVCLVTDNSGPNKLFRRDSLSATSRTGAQLLERLPCPRVQASARKNMKPSSQNPPQELTRVCLRSSWSRRVCVSLRHHEPSNMTFVVGRGRRFSSRIDATHCAEPGCSASGLGLRHFAVSRSLFHFWSCGFQTYLSRSQSFGHIVLPLTRMTVSTGRSIRLTARAIRKCD